ASQGPITSYTFSNITTDHKIEATFEKQITQTVIILQIGNTTFTVNGSPRTLDSPPIIKNNRTLLPIRAIIESLGGTVDWDPTLKKVEIFLGSNHLILQIGNANAYVNGSQKLIDPNNPSVYPEIINGRAMLPIRFIAENLGCDVQWDGTTKTITITYQQ
ncbi:MAG: copper amine oxidase N-terminal domain-containing protein, partial [Nitrososphaeria archaeon]